MGENGSLRLVSGRSMMNLDVGLKLDESLRLDDNLVIFYGRWKVEPPREQRLSLWMLLVMPTQDLRKLQSE